MLIEMSNASSFDGHGEMLRGLLSLAESRSGRRSPFSPPSSTLTTPSCRSSWHGRRTAPYRDACARRHGGRGRVPPRPPHGELAVGPQRSGPPRRLRLRQVRHLRVRHRQRPRDETLRRDHHGPVRRRASRVSHRFDAGQTQEQYESRIGDKTASLFPDRVGIGGRPQRRPGRGDRRVEQLRMELGHGPTRWPTTSSTSRGRRRPSASRCGTTSATAS